MSTKVAIEKLVYGGDGLGRLGGQVVLTPYVLPGEVVSVETARVKTGLLRGSSTGVVEEASEHRVTPRCPYFGTCGGCQYQHADYSYEVQQKVAILRETLQRLGGFAYEEEIRTITGEPWEYRNRIQLHFAQRRAGYYKASSHEICAIEECPISAPLLVEAIARIQEAVRRREWPDFLRSLELFTNGSELQITVLESTKPVAVRFFEWCKTFLPSLAPGAIEYQTAQFRFRVSNGSFFQVNRHLIDALSQEVAEGEEGSYGVDLYAGVGLFTLSLAKRFERFEAVERGLAASRDLEFNLRQSPRAVEAHRDSAESFLAKLEHSPDLMVVDPPRAGLGREATAGILRVRPKRLTIVSCDPATLARDARSLLESYRIRSMALVDLFPRTQHFETVMHLELLEGSGRSTEAVGEAAPLAGHEFGDGQGNGKGEEGGP